MNWIARWSSNMERIYCFEPGLYGGSIYLLWSIYLYSTSRRWTVNVFCPQKWIVWSSFSFSSFFLFLSLLLLLLLLFLFFLCFLLSLWSSLLSLLLLLLLLSSSTFWLLSLRDEKASLYCSSLGSIFNREIKWILNRAITSSSSSATWRRTEGWFQQWHSLQWKEVVDIDRWIDFNVRSDTQIVLLPLHPTRSISLLPFVTYCYCCCCYCYWYR